MLLNEDRILVIRKGSTPDDFAWFLEVGTLAHKKFEGTKVFRFDTKDVKEVSQIKIDNKRTVKILYRSSQSNRKNKLNFFQMLCQLKWNFQCKFLSILPFYFLG